LILPKFCPIFASILPIVRPNSTNCPNLIYFAQILLRGCGCIPSSYGSECNVGRMGVGSGGQGGRAPLNFHTWYKYSKYRLKKAIFRPFFLLFFVFFSVSPPLPRKWLNGAIFRYFLLIFGIFSVSPPPGKFFCRRPWLTDLDFDRFGRMPCRGILQSNLQQHNRKFYLFLSVRIRIETRPKDLQGQWATAGPLIHKPY